MKKKLKSRPKEQNTNKRMKLLEKLKVLQNKHFAEWIRTRRDVEEYLSNKQSMLCLCGRLATGLHERHCGKLQNKIISETVKKLEHLIVE